MSFDMIKISTYMTYYCFQNEIIIFSVPLVLDTLMGIFLKKRDVPMMNFIINPIQRGPIPRYYTCFL